MNLFVRAGGWIGGCVAAAGIGLGAGWYAAHQTDVAPAHAHGAGAHPPAKDDPHAGHAHGGGGAGFSEQSRRNMGIELAGAAVAPWSRTVSVPATIELPPDAVRTVASPVGGRLVEVRARRSTVVDAGAVVAVVLRDPLPTPDLTLTSDILRPAGEAMHDSARALRIAARNAEIQRSEIARLEKLVEPGEGGTLPIVPRKELIEARYRQDRADAEVLGARSELRHHGLTEQEVDEIQSGGRPAFLERSAWRRALEANGLWPAEAQALSGALPAEVRDLPMAVALVGELAARGRLSTGLAEWLTADAAAAREFLAVGVLALEGRSTEELRSLQAAGAFAPLVELRAQAGHDWDVVEVLGRPGDGVVAGQRIVALADARRAHLRVHAAGADAALLVRALESGVTMHAAPLVPDSGPILKKVRLLSLENDGGRVTLGVAAVPNEVLTVKEEGGGGRYRTWKLRPGMRYVLRVPVDAPVDAIVVPTEAIVEDGADRILYVEDGDTFRKAKIVVLHSNADEAALDPKHSDLFPGDRYVSRGAFALHMAILAAEGAGGVDPHAGHSH